MKIRQNMVLVRQNHMIPSVPKADRKSSLLLTITFFRRHVQQEVKVSYDPHKHVFFTAG